MTKRPTEREMMERLADFMVEELMNMSDEEILAESTPEEIEVARRDLKAAILKAECGDGERASQEPGK
jgi:hypothetical protein